MKMKKKNKKDENNNFDENYKKLLTAMSLGMRGSKDPNGNKEKNKRDENNNFDKNYKKLLSAMAWEGPKTPMKMTKKMKTTIFM